MGEFFRGWKRKTGMLTLVLACVFMAGWVRSSFFIEGLVIPLGMKSSASLVSSDSSLIWLTQQGDGFFSFPNIVSRRLSDIDDRIFENPLFEWRWKRCGFGIGACVDGTRQVGNQMIQMTPGTVAVVPCWSVTIPLMLVSMWLLVFSKPSQSIPQSTSQSLYEAASSNHGQ